MRWLRLRPLLLTALVLDFILLFLLMLSIKYPESLEEIYTRGVFAWYAKCAGWLSDRIPFSIHEAIGIALALALVVAVSRGCKNFLTKKATLSKLILKGAERLFIALSIFAFLFYLLWGLNYFRPRLIDSAQFDAGLVTTDRATYLSEKCLLVLQALENVSPVPDRDLPLFMQSAISHAMPMIGDRPLATSVRVKYFLGGWLSALPSTGVTLPLLPENHISLDLFDFEKPFIIAHEKAHLQGRALESEANFLALLACLSAEQPWIRRSGVFFLFRMLLRSLPPKQRLLYLSRIPHAAWHDFKAPALRMANKSPFIVALFQMFYGNFLKAQRIQDGLANYSAATQLALGYRFRNCKPLDIDTIGRIIKED